MLPIDARLGQIFCLASFLLLGVVTRDWTLQPTHIGIALLTCCGVQIGLVLGKFFWTASAEKLAANQRQQQELTSSSLISTDVELSLPTLLAFTVINRDTNFRDINFAKVFEQVRQSLPSALITGLGLSLLLRVDHLTTLILASTAAISSKFLLKINGKHIFNPANFGIVTVLVLTQDAWVSPGQWGESGWYGLLFLGAGGLVLRLVGRWDTTVAFLVTYIGLEAARNFWLGWTWDVWLHRLMSGSLLLFALFMITDPRTIPDAGKGRIIWASLLALLAFVLRNFCFLPTAVIWALFAISPLSWLFDRLLPAARFTWSSSSNQKSSASKSSPEMPQLAVH